MNIQEGKLTYKIYLLTIGDIHGFQLKFYMILYHQSCADFLEKPSHRLAVLNLVRLEPESFSEQIRHSIERVRMYLFVDGEIMS